MQLRKILKETKLHAFIVPTEDAHQSEYLCDADKRRQFISGFSGSAGTAIVTLDKQALWTDGRYYLQASQQLGEGWILQKQGLKETPSQEEWLNQVLEPGSRVGIDPLLHTLKAYEDLVKNLKNHEIVLVENLVDKLAKLRLKLKEKNCWGVIVSALDEICWLYNLRGSDIMFNPVFFAYSLITQEQAILYVEPEQVTDKVRAHVGKHVVFKGYNQIFEDLKQAKHETSLLIDNRCNVALAKAYTGSIENQPSLVQYFKAIKNETELQGFRNCHQRDAVALVRYFCWLENELVVKKTKITEAEAADRLEAFRKELDLFVGLSFDTISSTGANGSIIHYKPEHGTCAVIDPTKIYLCDSGAQFYDGTTDTTRTMHFGTPTEREKDAYTRVLKGHIQIDQLVFPAGTTGYVIDCLARTALWQAGLDFRHGTGHGVGSFLNVHEGPQGIGFRITQNVFGLEEGMTITDEPGYYEDGAFGIRIENILLVKKVSTPNRFGNQDYLGFEHVTCAPIQTKLVDKSLLTPTEIKWLNDYNKFCFERVSPLLKKDEPAYQWLVKETQSI
ncbi:peptidase M24, structural domain-containing protein [Gorgonomyces haynaldii]|nr:peptidase M24, structural domain-containing protein [Gorgonomyces haynaldii]